VRERGVTVAPPESPGGKPAGPSEEEKRRFREGRVMGFADRRVLPSATPCWFVASRLVDFG